mmetsp:Transcript_5738/g.14234  ORF Transcript_5738/g.14234 Transcript_5738/m.14234 type:complete len:326 (+) Transcript_5738:406-1383(+)
MGVLRSRGDGCRGCGYGYGYRSRHSPSRRQSPASIRCCRRVLLRGGVEPLPPLPLPPCAAPRPLPGLLPLLLLLLLSWLLLFRHCCIRDGTPRLLSPSCEHPPPERRDPGIVFVAPHRGSSRDLLPLPSLPPGKPSATAATAAGDRSSFPPRPRGQMRTGGSTAPPSVDTCRPVPARMRRNRATRPCWSSTTCRCRRPSTTTHRKRKRNPTVVVPRPRDRSGVPSTPRRSRPGPGGPRRSRPLPDRPPCGRLARGPFRGPRSDPGPPPTAGPPESAGTEPRPGCRDLHRQSHPHPHQRFATTFRTRRRIPTGRTPRRTRPSPLSW